MICILFYIQRTVVNTIYLMMFDYKHWSFFFLKGNKPGNLSVKEMSIMSCKTKIAKLLQSSSGIWLKKVVFVDSYKHIFLTWSGWDKLINQDDFSLDL